MTSNLSAFDFIQERSEATPGLFNRFLSALSANIAAVDSNATINLSGATLSIGSSVSIGRDLWVKGSITVGVEPSAATRTAVNIGVRSDTSDYLYFTDEAALRSNYIIGSHVGGTADGLNIWDASGSTMIVSFSKQSVRFYQNVVGPVFDVGGALADTLNAGTFGTGADSDESRIQAAISQATTDGISRVYVPANMYPYRSGLVSFATNVQMVREGGDWSVYDVWAYGAHGVGHDSAAIQSAASGAAANRGCVYFPPATYNLATSITLNNATDVQFRGPGGNGALVTMAASGVTLLRLTGVCSRIIIRDLWLGSFSSSYVNGGSIEVIGGTTPSDAFLVENVTCQNTPYPISLTSLYNSNFNNVRVFSSLVSCVRGSALSFNHVVSTNFHEFLVFINSSASIPADGIVVGEDCDTVIFMDSQVLGCIGYGVRVMPKVSSTGNRLGRFTNMLSESNTSGGFLIEGARDVHLASCHAAVNGGPGYKITGGDSVQLYDSLALQNNEEGIIYSGGRGGEIAGCVVSNNGQTANNTYDGIVLTSGTSGVRIANNRSGNFVISGGNGQRSGISIAASTDYLSIVNNDCIGNVSNGYFSASTGANNFVLDSSNLTSSSGGTITALSGAIVRNTLIVGTDPGNGGEIIRIGGHGRFNGYIKTEGANGAIRLDNRTSSNSSILGIFNQSGTDFNFANISNSNLYMRLGGTVFSAISLTPETSGAADLGSVNRPWGRVVVGTGTVLAPSSTFSSDASVGFYRSGVSTIAISTGTFNLATNAVRLSMRTLAASSLTPSAANTNVAVNECVFTVGGASGASFAIHSGGTVYIFDSTSSAKAT